METSTDEKESLIVLNDVSTETFGEKKIDSEQTEMELPVIDGDGNTTIASTDVSNVPDEPTKSTEDATDSNSQTSESASGTETAAKLIVEEPTPPAETSEKTECESVTEEPEIKFELTDESANTSVEQNESETVTESTEIVKETTVSENCEILGEVTLVEESPSENDVNFKKPDEPDTSAGLEKPPVPVSENVTFNETGNNLEDDEDIEFQVILNDDPGEVVSINGIPQLLKEDMVASQTYHEEEPPPETIAEVKMVVVEEEEEMVVQEPPLESDSELTYSVVEEDSQSEMVAFTDQDGSHEVVILEDDQMLIMEAEEFDHPESIEVNYVDDEKGSAAESMTTEEEEEEEDEEEEWTAQPQKQTKQRRTTRQQHQRQKKQKQKSANEVQIPCHVLGRTIEKPLNDTVRNGKVLMKPRLGVKIPYRNLTSQIVSKQDIANEIMERSRLKQSTIEPPVGGDVFFAKKLTRRLATKLIVPGSGGKLSTKTAASTSSSSSTTKKDATPQLDASDKITDNSDLIALLEGDDDPEWSSAPDKVASLLLPPANQRTPEWERETALKQLRELPRQTKVSGPRMKITSTSSPVKSAVQQSKVAEKPAKSSGAATTTTTATVGDANTDSKDDVNNEPRFSSSLVTKTYTRKRKPSEDILKPILAQTMKKTGSDENKMSQLEIIPVVPTTSPKSPVPSPSPAVNQKSVTIQKVTLSAPAPKSGSIPALKPIQKSPPTITATVDNKNKSPSSSSRQPQPQQSSSPPTTGVEAQKTPTSNTYISKSSRIVKKKKIWDPDEAIPFFKITSIKSPKSSDVPSSPGTSTNETKSPGKPVEKSSTVKEVEQTEEDEEEEKKVVVVTVSKPSNEKSSAVQKKIVSKRGGIVKKKKPRRLTEVDKLLMDEGAVNLLYSVRNTDDLHNVNNKKKKKTMMISKDKVQQELLNKTNEIKNDLQINSAKDSPISLRKKDGGVTSKQTSSSSSPAPVKETTLATAGQHNRKKSKDSGSNHSPPASPGYAFSHTHAEASRIIRRHSSSSFSSENNDGDENHAATAVSKKQPVFVEPQKKRQKLAANSHEKHVLRSATAASSIGVDKQLLNEEMSKNFNRLPAEDPKYSQFETFNVRKFDRLVQIILVPASSTGQTTLSIQVLSEFVQVLNVLEKDDACRVVVVSSSGNSFCQGINYKELVSDNKEQRKTNAENYATHVRQFLLALSKFTKLLVAGVHGNTIGLGVTMLPLFDMVLASDTATFSTPYTHLGCAAEGGVLLSLPYIMHNALASELFFASRKLTAAEALRLGLVTRTLWPDKFQEELISALKIISNQSSQSMEGIKKQLRHSQHMNIESSLKTESIMLVKHWLSDECQTNFDSYSLESK